MKRFVFPILFVLLFSADRAGADTPSGKIDGPHGQLILNGEVIANEISKATGYAISPILGISVLGAYTYYTTPAAERHRVPWHARPVFWAPLLAVLLGIILKDSSKVTLPKIILVPLDAIETLLEKNTSAVLGLLVIISSITGRGLEQLQLTGAGGVPFSPAAAHAAEGANAAASVAAAGTVELAILTLIVTLVFTLVWVVSQSFNFLIFLCPFSWLDLLLTTAKNSVILLLAGAWLLNPFLGLAVSGVIILTCLVLFARSYRFVIFGTICTADILLRKSRQQAFATTGLMGFAGSLFPGVAPLSYGSLTINEAVLVFRYRPWLFLPQRIVITPFRNDRCVVGKGTLSPVLLAQGDKQGMELTLFRLRPRYTSHEQRVAELFSFIGVRDVAFGKSIREGYRWLKDQLGCAGKMEQRTV